MLSIIAGVVFLVVLGLALTGKGRYLIKGLSNMFFQDIAKTPKGAEAIYTQAIEDAQISYNKANNNLQRIAGILNTSKNNLKETEAHLTTTKSKMEQMAKAQKFEQVDLYAEELGDTDELIAVYKSEVAKYEPMLEQAKLLSNQYEAMLSKLKKDKVVKVRQLELNIQSKEMFDELDELKNTKASHKLLDSVKEGIIQSEETATGARLIHENKRSTRLAVADSQIKAGAYSSYAEELKNKYKQ